MPTTMKSEESIFTEALDKDSPQARVEYLDNVCGSDSALRARVENLLRSHEHSDSFLRKPPATTLDEPARERPGAIVGRYKLLEQIGEGGMGVVFMAEQTRPVQRRVALKIIKAGMDTREVVARFEAERQALAMMDHPNIARVLEAGATDTGRPYFVMELVRGVPVTEFCDQKTASVRDRLELFITICQAVQHAHQKGIIHRDIKPTNVLVTLHDGRPVIKVIDFGVAKATGQKLTDKTLFTGFAQMVGTPLYMSPEQAEMSGLDVDTRSDIFSAGVLLYELLTGSTPFDSQRLKSASFDELRRIIREEEPPRPSTRLTTLALEAASTVGTQRKSDPRQLSRLFRGELDWIVMKCLEKDRTRRYETASALASDVERDLHDEPVEACPPSARYRFGKFARRNKATFVTVVAVMVTLLLGTVVSTWQAIRANNSEAQAETDRQAETAQRKRAEAISNLLVNSFRSPDPDRDGRTIRIAEILDRSVKTLQGMFADDPVTKAKLRQAIGESYIGLGLYREAIPLLEQARDLYVGTVGREHLDTLGSMNDLAVAYLCADRPNEALPLAEETLKLRRAKLGLDHTDTLLSMNTLATVYSACERQDEAITLYEETVKLTKVKLGPEHGETLMAMNNLAIAYDNIGRFDEALSLDEETLKLQTARLGPEHPDTLVSMGNLALDYKRAGRFEKALRLSEETCNLSKAKLGPEHPFTLWSMSSLAEIYGDCGRHDEAVTMAEEVVKHQKATMGPEHSYTLETMDDMVDAYLRVNRLAEAETIARECLAIREKKRPSDWKTFNTRDLLGSVLLGQKKYDEAEPLLISGYEGMHGHVAKIPACDKPRLEDAVRRLVHLYEATKRPEKAAAWRAELIEFDKAAAKANPAAPKNETSPTRMTESATKPKPTPPATNNSGK